MLPLSLSRDTAAPQSMPNISSASDLLETRNSLISRVVFYFSFLPQRLARSILGRSAV